MYYVGIDIAKLNHFASVISEDGEVLLIKPFEFTNDNDGFCKPLCVLASYEHNSFIIGLESTAHYTNKLVVFLVSKPNATRATSSTLSRLPRCIRTVFGKLRPIRWMP